MNIIIRQIKKLKERGYSTKEAREITYNQQLKNGNIIPGTFKLTDKGKEYSKLTPKERDLLRNKKYNE